MQQPHFNQWVNHFRAGLYCMVAWAGLLLCVLCFSPNKGTGTFNQSITTAMLAGRLRMQEPTASLPDQRPILSLCGTHS